MQSAMLRLEIRDLCLLIWLALLSGVVLYLAGGNIGDFPRVSGDDAWIMSASHKLATTGVFGSDLYRGYANADRHYFIALPVYQALQGVTFLAAGTSVAAARSVTLVSGLVALWCTGWLARRWYGVSVAVIATGLLVIWRTYLLDLASGLSFISVSRTGRYDATAMALVLLTIVGLDLLRARDRNDLAFGVGAVAGLAALTQFTGAFATLFIVALMMVEHGWRCYRLPVARWLAAGWMAVMVPYAVYTSVHWTDFVGQSELKADRMGFDRPGFYIENLLDEPDRYLRLFNYLGPTLDGRYHRFNEPLSPFLFGFASVVALGLLARRLLRGPTPGDRWLALAVAVFALSLALIDQTNATIYAAVLLPLLCVAVAVMIVCLLGWALRYQSAVVGVTMALLVVAPLVIVIQEGVAAHRQEVQWSNEIIAYDDVAAEIDLFLPAGAPVLGMERWWAGLYRTHDYVAISALALQIDGGDSPAGHLPALIEVYGIAAVIVDEDARGVVRAMPEPARTQFDAFMNGHLVHTGSISGQAYGQIDVYLVQ